MPRRLVLAALMWHTIHQLSAPFLSVQYTPLTFALADSGGHGSEPTDPGDEEENPIDTGESEPFPTLPQQYSTNVLVTFQELGYTLEYTEYYDAHLNKSRHDTVAPDSFTVVTDFYDWNTDEAYQSNGTKCGVTHLPVSTYEMPHVGPSVESWFFKIGPTGGNMFDTAQFEGLSLERRGILCNVFAAWHVIHPAHDLTIDYDIRYYFAAASDDPVAVMIFGTRTNSTSGAEYHFRHYYDWSVWVRGPPSETVFELPSECATAVPIQPEEAMPTAIDNAADSAADFHSVNSTSNTTGHNTPPRLASRFTAVLETRLDDSSSLVNEVEWYFDKTELRERMDYYVAGREGEEPIIYVNRYLEGSATTVVFIEDESGCRTTAVSVKGNDSETMAEIPTPLHTLHAGSVPELFAGINHHHKFHGTYTVRGVPCDVWRANLTRTRHGTVFNLTEDIYFYPAYWQFPMRSVYDSVGNLPVRIAISGHYIDPETGEYTPYSEEWNFFMGIPLEPAAEHFQLHCPDFLDTASSTHAIIALFLVCLVVAASCLLGACYYWRHRFHKPGLKHHYNMHDLKHFVRHEMKRRQKAEAARHRRLSVATHLSDGDQPRSPVRLSAIVCASPQSQAAASDTNSTDKDSESSTISEPHSTRSSPGVNMFSSPIESPSNDQLTAGLTRIVPFSRADRHELAVHPLHEAHPTHSVNLNAYDPLARSSLRSSFSAAAARVGFRFGFGSRYSFGAGHSFDAAEDTQADAPISTGGSRLQSELRMRAQEMVPVHPMPMHSAFDSHSVSISVDHPTESAPSSSADREDSQDSPFHSPDMLP